MLKRVQRIIAESGRCSRRAAEALIEAGLVTVNGRPVALGDRADAEKDAIKVEGKLLKKPEPHRYILLYKPKGIITTADDPEGRSTVLDLIRPGVPERVYPVGRLDVMTEGLLFLTNDGDFALRVTHPSWGCRKEYLAKVRGEIPERTLERLRRGIVLDGKRTAPAEISFVRRSRRASSDDEANSWFRVILREGRNHEVRRLFDVVGHSVLKLKRVAIGPIRDEKLLPGQWRDLEPGEVRAILAPKR